jgi:hypothetical protein
MNWKEISDEIFPFHSLVVANRILRRINKEIVDTDSPKLSYMADYALLNVDRVKEYYERSFDSKKIIEEKIKTSLISLTLASSFTFAFATIDLSDGFKKQEPIVLFLVGLLLTSAIFYFISSGVIALRAMSESNKIYILSPKDEGQTTEDQKKRLFATLTELNVNENTIRQNYMSVSFNCIRNGVILMIIIPVVLFFSTVFFNKNIKEKNRVAEELSILNQTVSSGISLIQSSSELIKNSIDTNTATMEREMEKMMASPQKGRRRR